MTTKSIWLTGSRGFIGKHLVQKLNKKNYKIACISNNIQVQKKVKSNVTFLDYSSRKKIEKYIERFGCPDIFIHLGWGAMTSTMSPIHLTSNVTEGKILIETLFASGLEKFIFIGSMNEYGSRVGLLSEDMEPLGKLIDYAQAKIKVAKHGFKMAHSYNKIFIHLRPFYVYGPGQRQGSLINELFDAFQADRKTNLGPCDYYRDYIYVQDVVEGIIRSIDIKDSYTINLGNGSYIKVKDFVAMFWSNLGGAKNMLKFGSKSMLQNEPEQPKSFADLTRLDKLTNWKPSYSLEEGIKSTIEILYSEKGK